MYRTKTNRVVHEAINGNKAVTRRQWWHLGGTTEQRTPLPLCGASNAI